MSKFDIIRAWKDAEYRSGLSEAERAMLPDNPAGSIILSDPELDSVAGGDSTFLGGCQPFTDGLGGCPPSYPGICTCIDICPFTAPGPLCPDPYPILI